MEDIIETAPTEIQQQHTIVIDKPLEVEKQLLENGCNVLEETGRREIYFEQPEQELLFIREQPGKTVLVRLQHNGFCYDVVSEKPLPEPQKALEDLKKIYPVIADRTLRVKSYARNEHVIDITFSPKSGAHVVIHGPFIDQALLKDLGFDIN